MLSAIAALLVAPLASPLFGALPSGLDRDTGIDMDAGIRFVGAQLPPEVESGGKLDVTLYFVTSKPLSPDLLSFMHLESGGDCRIVFDRAPPAPVDGVIAHHVVVPVPSSCAAGTRLKLQTGLYSKADDHRVRVVQPPSTDDRIYAGTVAIVARDARSEPSLWTIPRLRYDSALGSRHPPWSLALGVVLALGLLALARQSRAMRHLALDDPRLFARLDPLPIAEKLALLAVAVWALAFVVQYVNIAAQTVGYPYQLEWMEGGVIETVQRLRDGQSIYGPPSVEYVPYIYPPGYIAATAAVSLVTGVDFLAARLVSFVSILGAAWLVFRFIQRETQGRMSRLWGLVGVGFLFATYAVTARWFHLARVDSFYLLLLLWPLYLLRYRRGMRSAVAAGLLMTACTFTKQAAPIALLPAVGLMFLAEPGERRRTFVAGLVFAGTALVAYLVAQAMSDGWFGYYMWEVPKQHAIVDEFYKRFWTADLWPAAPLLCMGTAGLAFFAARVGRRAAFHVGLFVGFLASAWLSRLHSGGIANVLIPGFAALAVMAPIGMAALEPQPVAGLRGPGAAATRIGLALFVAFQFFALGYSTGDSLPAPDAREKGAKFTEYLSHIDGDVLLPDHDFIQRRAGKRDYALGMASRDLLRMESSDDPGKLMLEASIREAFAGRRFAAVILSEEDHLRSLLLPTYCFKERIDLAPSPITGWVIRPQWVWVPRLAGTPTDRVECMR